ncbi:MAG: DUF3237 domain-containing protein [Proteobacteria bacterium]|nr:DUF3237 domain-containing protein [Pseudomonadota bacterium]MDA1059269.1 DUF3237 domain-containing protein [Pseudomonadota bacterium]
MTHPDIAPLETTFLTHFVIEAMPGLEIGKTPGGWRRVDRILSGRFDGPRFSGEIITGTDPVLVMRDDSARLDVRMVLRTVDDALVQMTYDGIVAGPRDVMKRIGRREEVDSREYYLRTAVTFETGDTRYEWLNTALAVATGRLLVFPNGAFGDHYNLYLVQ